MRRVRRPLLALIALIVALAIGYAVRAFTGADDGAPSGPSPSISHSQSALPFSASPGHRSFP